GDSSKRRFPSGMTNKGSGRLVVMGAHVSEAGHGTPSLGRDDVGLRCVFLLSCSRVILLFVAQQGVGGPHEGGLSVEVSGAALALQVGLGAVAWVRGCLLATVNGCGAE